MPDTTTTDLIDAKTLFGYEHEGACCDCCNDLCAMSFVDEPEWEWAESLLTLELDGQRYVATQYLMVRRDLLAGLDKAKIIERTPARSWRAPFHVPSSQPLVYAGVQRASLVDRIDRAGLTRHDAGDDVIVHLYASDQHVGWAAKGVRSEDKPSAQITSDQLDPVRRIAAAAHIGADWAAIALNEMTR